MPKVAVEFGLEQIGNIIKQLDTSQRNRLLRLIKEDWQKDFEEIAREIRRNAHKNKVSDKEIIEMVEDVRKRIYGRRN